MTQIITIIIKSYIKGIKFKIREYKLKYNWLYKPVGNK